MVAVLFMVFVLAETGLELVNVFTDLVSGWCSGPMISTQDKTQEEKRGVLNTITSYCLPKLVCQLYSLTNANDITDSERNLINLIGSVGLTSTPSKYSYAAHMGQLVRGVNGQGCHNFYPDCPFSNTDVMELTRRFT